MKRISVTFVAAWLLLAAGTAQERQPIKVAVAPPLCSAEPKFENSDREFLRQTASEVLAKRLRKAAESAEYQSFDEESVKAAMGKLGLDLSRSKDRGGKSLMRLGEELNANFLIFVWITDVRQQNHEVSAVLSNLSGPASTTHVKARLWLLDVVSNKLVIDGKEVSGEAKGPRFGTTKRGELSGHPDDVGAAIRDANRRRAEWVGRAAWEAVKPLLGQEIGLKDGIEASR